VASLRRPRDRRILANAAHTQRSVFEQTVFDVVCR